jgi:hypothetical protein
LLGRSLEGKIGKLAGPIKPRRGVQAMSSFTQKLMVFGLTEKQAFLTMMYHFLSSIYLIFIDKSFLRTSTKLVQYNYLWKISNIKIDKVLGVERRGEELVCLAMLQNHLRSIYTNLRSNISIGYHFANYFNKAFDKLQLSYTHAHNEPCTCAHKQINTRTHARARAHTRTTNTHDTNKALKGLELCKISIALSL